MPILARSLDGTPLNKEFNLRLYGASFRRAFNCHSSIEALDGRVVSAAVSGL